MFRLSCGSRLGKKSSKELRDSRLLGFRRAFENEDQQKEELKQQATQTMLEVKQELQEVQLPPVKKAKCAFPPPPSSGSRDSQPVPPAPPLPPPREAAPVAAAKMAKEIWRPKMHHQQLPCIC